MSVIRINNHPGTCDTHGPYIADTWAVSGKIKPTNCPTCFQAQLEKNAVLIAEQAKRDLEEGRGLRDKQAGVPFAFKRASLDELKAPSESAASIHRTCRQYVEGFDRVLEQSPPMGMIFTGLPGTGKTHLACGMVRRLLDLGKSARIVSLPSLLLELGEASKGWGASPIGYVLDTYKKTHLLVLDEYGTHSKTDRDYQLIFDLIDGRYKNGLPTILLTNVPRARLAEELDERVLERVKGPRGLILSFDWKSFRV
ncbi:MAG: hypothetical protein RJA99_3129 [Pseudomonadota bacterium]|jgi:DNA replication protein DnaC